MLMKNVQFPGAEDYESQMAMHNSTANTENSLAREFQKIFQTQYRHMDCCIMARTEDAPVNGIGLIVIIMSKKENTCLTY